jgi:hypothetical protein
VSHPLAYAGCMSGWNTAILEESAISAVFNELSSGPSAPSRKLS